MPPVDDLPTMERYDLIFEGDIRDGVSIDEVKRNLAKLYGVSVREIESLFTGEPIYIRKAMDLVSALEDKEVFEATGALLRLEPSSEADLTGVHEARIKQPSPGKPASPDPSAGSAPEPVEIHNGADPAFGSAFYRSFYSGPFYRHAARTWKRQTLIYLVLLSVIYSIAAVYRFKTETVDIVNASAPILAQQLPEIAIDNGTVRIEGSEPYLIRNPDGSDVLAILDTTGEYTNLENTDAILLLTADRLMVRRGAGAVREFDLSSVDGFRLNRELMMKWIQSMMAWMPVVIFPFAALAALVFRLVQALLFGALGVAVAGSLRRSLTFQTAFSIAALALTPVILLDTVFIFLGITVPYWGVLGLLVTAGYVIYGVRAATTEEET